MTAGPAFLVLHPLLTERTTALTDLLVAAAAGGASLRLLLAGQKRTGLWASALGTAAAAALLGGAAHGLVLPPTLFHGLWRGIYALLAAAVAFAAAAAGREALGAPAARVLFGVLAGGAALFWLLTTFWSSSFSLFVGYEAAGLGLALALLGSLLRKGRPGAGLGLSGLLLLLAAGVVQASGPFVVYAGVPLDHNALFHLLQLPAFFLVAAGAERLGASPGFLP
ncbi:MAG: DUF6962 family protein [Acidobacteriota bacterium]